MRGHREILFVELLLYEMKVVMFKVPVFVWNDSRIVMISESHKEGLRLPQPRYFGSSRAVLETSLSNSLQKSSQI